MRDELPNTETETYEHIPWSQLTLTNGSTDRGKWMYVAAALLVAGAIAAVIARMIWQPNLAVAVSQVSSTVPAPVATTVDAVPAAALYSEADLLAVSAPRDIEQGIAAAAERYVRQWVGSAGDSWTYLEWTTVESVEDLGQGLFRVTMLLQLLYGGEQGTVRLPVEALDVTVHFENDQLAVVDLPSPAPVEPISALEPTVETTELPQAVAAAAAEAASPWGIPTIVGGGVVDDLWRVEVSVESTHGPVRVVAVWLTPDGSPAHPMP